ncbi:hypothetical protein PR048_021308 [Dryococelus australis]|uniref:Uncharacterized protein n=1 Tax=Dryococelus australis TaxID=614101 RepID=A0ABQ9GY06_9NEOP|nr:hypothetical protein PR048_021308 [Dryococelus australis]
MVKKYKFSKKRATEIVNTLVSKFVSMKLLQITLGTCNNGLRQRLGLKETVLSIEKAVRWQEILKCIITIILYLAEHKLTFHKTSSKVFSKNNGNFLGLV